MKKMRVAILGAFSSLPDTYSVARVASEQLRAFVNEGVDCRMWTLDHLKLDEVPQDIREYVTPTIRPQKMIEDVVDTTRSDMYAADILAAFRDYEPTHVITHDLLFQASHIDFAKAVHDLEPMTRSACWFHYLHSSVHGDSGGKSVPVWRRSLPEAHFLIYPTQADTALVAKRYNTSAKRVYACPNVHDPRSRWRLSDAAQKIIEDTHLMQKDVVQIFPACGTRLNAKGLSHAISLFAAMKNRGKKVLLLVLNANGGCEASVQNVQNARKLADRLRLGEDELVISSERWPEWQDGISQADVAALFMLSTLFVFPSIAEANPLSLIEAMQSGCLCVLNKNVPGIVEQATADSIWADFPSVDRPNIVYDEPTPAKGRKKKMTVGTNDAYLNYIDNLAEIVLERWSENPALQARVRSLRLNTREAFLTRIFEIFRHAEQGKIPLRSSRSTTITAEKPPHANSP